MGDLHLAGNNVTDKVKWPNSKELTLELDIGDIERDNVILPNSGVNIGELNLSDCIESDNVKWSNSKELALDIHNNIESDNVHLNNSRELILSPKEFDLTVYTSEDECSNEDSDSTLSVTDLQNVSEKNPNDTNIGQLNLTSCSGVHIGNQAYYHGDVTIQQYVVNAKEAVHALPGQTDVKGNITFVEGGVPAFVTDKDGNKNLKSVLASLKKRHFWYAFMVLLFIIGLTVTLLVLYLPSDIEEDPDTNENATLILYNREDWHALPSRNTLEQLQEDPPHYVIIAHTALNNCTNFNECANRVKFIQDLHMGRGWPDLSMNFLVGGDGAAYTGRGWGKKGMHTAKFNTRSICIHFIGNFMFQLPPKRQIKAAQMLIEEGVRLGKIKPDYKLFVHKQVMATESPGAALIPEVMKWPHWSTFEKSDEIEQ